MNYDDDEVARHWLTVFLYKIIAKENRYVSQILSTLFA
jgi:hypothetical protein